MAAVRSAGRRPFCRLTFDRRQAGDGPGARPGRELVPPAASWNADWSKSI